MFNKSIAYRLSIFISLAVISVFIAIIIISYLFNSNNLKENIENKVNGDEKIYGIQIKQDYYSTNYADKGYLFLMIDLNDSINPKIYVRTWQPEKNDDGSIFGLNDFEIN